LRRSSESYSQMNKITAILKMLKLCDHSELEFDEIAFKNSIELSESISKVLSNFEDEGLIQTTHKSKVKCSNGHDLKISPHARNAYCVPCQTSVPLQDVARLNISVNLENVRLVLLDEIKKAVVKSGASILSEENKFLLVQLNEKLICFSFGLSTGTLDDYFKQRGYPFDKQVQGHVIIRPQFDSELTSYSYKDLKCACISIQKLLTPKDFASSM